jgi:hypothetical protein
LRRFRAPCDPDAIEALRVIIERGAVDEEEPPGLSRVEGPSSPDRTVG